MSPSKPANPVRNCAVGSAIAALILLGPVAAFKLAITVGRLPKTRSGKILRASIRKIADGEQFTVPPTIEDPAALDEVRGALARSA